MIQSFFYFTDTLVEQRGIILLGYFIWFILKYPIIAKLSSEPLIQTAYAYFDISFTLASLIIYFLVFNDKILNFAKLAPIALTGRQLVMTHFLLLMVASMIHILTLIVKGRNNANSK